MANANDLIRRLTNLYNEDSDGGWLDEQTSYDYLYDGAIEFVDRTGCLRASQSITTVATKTDYDINPDFLRLYLKNTSNNYYLKLYDTSNYHFLTWKDYEDIYYGNNTTSVAIPGKFTIIDADLPDKVIGTTTSDGADSGGQQTLTDTAGDFSDVNAGAIVHNTSDASSGIVLSKTSSTVLVTALFNGTSSDYTSGDAYVIQPQARYKLIIDPPPSKSGYTIYLPYVQRPAPVYSDYGIYAFVNPSALVKYAFWLYKYRDKDPNFGDAMYKFWEMEVSKKAYSINRGQRPTRIKVNMKARR